MHLNHNSQSGFSMVEVMVALLVLSVGLLGMAGLYVTTLRSGSGSIFRMQATYLASDMSDRIRANRLAGSAYEGAAATAAGCATVTCTQAQMAANDLFVWNTEIARLLPAAATHSIDYDGSTSPATYTITLQWSDPGSTAIQQYQLVTQI